MEEELKPPPMEKPELITKDFGPLSLPRNHTLHRWERREQETRSDLGLCRCDFLKTQDWDGPTQCLRSWVTWSNAVGSSRQSS